jgi:tRNA-specific 2-thiouridylase
VSVTPESARVLVAMSGGVDSSVAAALLLEQGYDVTGVTLKLWGGESDSGCCSVSDVEDARRVAAQLGIPHYVFNFTEEFDTAVVAPYVDAYADGRTPNPCVECNRSLKFGRLLERAETLGFDFLATGHHARVERATDGSVRLRRGVDAAKDQSYVLYMLGPRELARTLLPVGELTKAEVRAHAVRLGLRTASKPESMDVCFITRGGREEFLAGRAHVRAGAIVDTQGATVGAHAGVANFTVGQRRGLGVAVGERRYVVDVDAATATVTIGRRDDLLRDTMELRDVVFTDGRVSPRCALTAQVRAHGEPVAAALDGTTLCFDAPQPRVAPGQVVALYDDDRLVGGGIAT